MSFIGANSPDGMPIDNPRQSIPPQKGSGKQVDPVTANYVVDNGQSERPYLRTNPRLSYGRVAQKNFKPLTQL